MKKLILLLLLAVPTLIYSQDDTYIKVTDYSSLESGDNVIIVSEKSSKAMSSQGKTSNNRLSVDVEIDNNQINYISPDVKTITLEETEGGWYMKVEDGYLAVMSDPDKDKYYLRTVESTEPPSERYQTKMTITADEDGDAFINFSVLQAENKKKYVNVHISFTSNVFNAATGTKSNVCLYRSLEDVEQIEYNTSSSASAMLSKHMNVENVSVTLVRSFTTDRSWHALCLPFNVSAMQMKRIFGNDVMVQEFESVYIDSDGLLMNFVGTDGNIEAGKPYLIKPAKEVDNPVFKHVTITVAEPQTVSKGDYKFIGLFSPKTFTANDEKTCILTGSSGKDLKNPDADNRQLKGTQAYFRMPKPSSQGTVRAVTDDEPNGISNVEMQQDDVQVVFSIDGKPLSDSKKILHKNKGIYIYKGKKFIGK